MSNTIASVIIPAAILGIIPEYQSHKVVRAGKITNIVQEDEIVKSTVWVEIPAYDNCALECSAEWLEKHKPQVGGYLVIYQDGYVSYSPAEPFESGYTALTPEAPTTYLDRLKSETKKVEEYLDELTSFLSIPDADRKPEQTPSPEEMHILRVQRVLMHSLLGMLKNRLSIHGA